MDNNTSLTGHCSTIYRAYSSAKCLDKFGISSDRASRYGASTFRFRRIIMKKTDIKSIFSIFLALLVLVSVVVSLCAFSIVMTNFCTTYTVIARCNDSVVMVNVLNKYDRQIRTIDANSTIKNGDIVNYYMLLVRSYTPKGVEILSDDYDKYNFS